ncbi:MAG: hypothetical protein R3E53_20970 [Myxococcota bacterium]
MALELRTQTVACVFEDGLERASPPTIDSTRARRMRVRSSSSLAGSSPSASTCAPK